MLSDKGKLQLAQILDSGRYRQRRGYTNCSVCNKIKAVKTITTNDFKAKVCLDCEAELTDKGNKQILMLIKHADKDCVPIVVETNNEGIVEELMRTEDNYERLQIFLDYMGVPQ